jgi:hypothetical protein
MALLLINLREISNKCSNFLPLIYFAHSLSTTIAIPKAPAAQTVIKPKLPPLRLSSLSIVIVSLPPVAPKG